MNSREDLPTFMVSDRGDLIQIAAPEKCQCD